MREIIVSVQWKNASFNINMTHITIDSFVYFLTRLNLILYNSVVKKGSLSGKNQFLKC